MKYFYCTSIFILLFSLQTIAQNTKLLMRSGDKCFSREQYKNAYPYYSQVLKTDPENVEALYKIGVCNLHRFSKEEALANLENVYARDSTYTKYLLFWLGRAHHLNYNFEKAENFYSQFQFKISRKSIQYQEVERYKYQLTCGADFLSNPSNFKVRNLGPTINSSYSEHSPVLSQTDSMLLFTSRRSNSIDTKEEYDGEPFEDVFYSHKIDDSTWTEPKSFQLNTTGHDASIQLYDNDTKLFIYSYLHGGDIYTSNHENGLWTTPVSVKEINTVDFEADVFLTSDGNTLYYASNHFKKNGDLDICYLTKYSNGTWSKPKTLSSIINTDQDEDAPYISADGRTMYFSSRGHTSMGGYDVFKSTLDTLTGNWTKPINLGYPVNTPDEDLYFVLSHTSAKAYMSSYRTGGFGEKDIYEVQLIESVQVNGQLVNNQKEPVNGDGNIIKIVPLASATKNAQSHQLTVSSDGTFELLTLSDNDYAIYVMDGIDTVATDTIHVALVSDKNQTIYYSCVIPTKVLVDSSNVKTDSTVVAAIAVKKVHIVYFASNLSNVGPSTKAELRKLVDFMGENSGTKITVTGHADGSGPELLNNMLALKRANSVRAYLVLKGIATSRITVESFGSSKPIASNETEAGRSKNRRVEIVVE